MPDKNVLKFNQVENKNRVESKSKITALNRVIRNNCDNVLKCVLYSTDIDSGKIITVPPSKASEYAVVEIFDKNDDPKKFELSIKMTQAVLIANKYKVMASKKFKKEYNVCKMVVKLI